MTMSLNNQRHTKVHMYKYAMLKLVSEVFTLVSADPRWFCSIVPLFSCANNLACGVTEKVGINVTGLYGYMENNP